MATMLLTFLYYISLTIQTSKESESNNADWLFRKIGRRSADDSVNWALDRLNEHSPSLLNDGKISSVAEGDVYVVGSGVRATHTEFGSRVLQGWSWDGSDSRVDCGEDSATSTTGAASITAGKHLGIARTANIIPVKVGCTDTMREWDLKAGLKWISQHISSLPTNRAVILLTQLPTPNIYRDVAEEVNRLAEDHLVVVPAGDTGADVCGDMALWDEVGIMIVASSTSTDTNSKFSNYGNCVDIWAPGEGVSVASPSDDISRMNRSSTVFAAAAVAGTAVDALITMREVGEVDVLKGTLLSRATQGALDLQGSASNSVNRLLFDICPYYNRPSHGKCYLAQTTNLRRKRSEMPKVAKSVVTFDGMAYNYFDDCITVLVFNSTETTTTVKATHQMASDGTKETIFTIYTAEQNVTLSPGPLVRVNAGNVDLTSVYHSPSEDDYFYIIRHDIEIQTMLDDERFVPIVTVFLPKNVTVTYDGHQQIRIAVDTDTFKEKTGGICGFLDNSHVKEFVDREGNAMEFTFQKNKNKFIEEWAEKEWTDDCAEHMIEECNEAECLQAAEDDCRPLKNETGEFGHCFGKLNPSSWYSNCVEASKVCCCMGPSNETEKHTKECACTEQLKYWWAALLEGCPAKIPCETPCTKPETDHECTDDSRSLVDFFYKDKILYKPIDECHYVDKHDTVECKHDGSWNDKPTDCKIKTCDAPEVNARVEIRSGSSDDYQCGDEVEYQCKKTECDCNCYSMVGAANTQCSTNGERSANWTLPPPTCSLNHCDKPLSPNVDKQITSDLPLSWVINEETLDTSCCYGRAQFACHDCYELHGEAELQCCNNKWGDTSYPECRLKQCVDPAFEVETSGDMHLVVHAPDFSCSHVITYSCRNTCYEIIGTTSRACQTDGTWSGTLPTCVKKKCPAITDYEEGKYVLQGSVVEEGTILDCGDTIKTKCNDCHWPCTSTCERTCKWNGTETVWSNSEPKCSTFHCRQREIANAKIISKKGALNCGESSEVKCNTCYKQMSGDNNRTCNAPVTNETCPITNVEGVYGGEEVECVQMSCPELILGEHVKIKKKDCTNDFDCDCLVTFECGSDCYKMVGESTLRCDGFGWDHDVPKCVIKTCPFIKPYFSRKYNYDKEWPGGCQFVKEGERVTEDTKLECGDIMTVQANHTHCYHVCNNGQLICQPNGHWNLTESFLPNCMYMECNEPPKVPNAELVNDEGKYNCTTELEYKCDPCYKHASGNLKRKCIGNKLESSPDGIWDGEPPVCEKMECPIDEYVHVANATAEIRDKSCGGKLVYKCDECSALIGKDEHTCNHTDLQIFKASWARDTPPTCEPICCPPLPSFPSGDEDYDVVATSARYLHGPHVNHEKCGDDYVCQEIEAKCDECYEYKTSDGFKDYAPTRNCIKSNGIGYWSNAEKVCTRKQCSANEISADYHLRYTRDETTTQCNQTIGVECDCCYKISEDVIRDYLQCLPNKLWDKELPKCTPINCNEPLNITNGHYSKIDSIASCSCGTVTYTCDSCFRLVGEAILTCQQDKDLGTAQWSNAPPVCEPICCEALEEPIDMITEGRSTSYSYRKDAIHIEVLYNDISVKENYDSCSINHACQVIDAKCETCYEYNGNDSRSQDGTSHPPSKYCEKREVEGEWVGRWTNMDRVCSLKKCEYRAIDKENSLHYSQPENYSDATSSYCMSNITVTCNDCFELSDGSRSETHQCQPNKSWSHDLPICQRSQCPEPPAVQRCSYQPGENECGSSRKLECDECFYDNSCTDETLSSDRLKVQCNYDKSWSWILSQPQMKIRECSPASEIANGNVDVTGSTCGDMARYTCNRCYKFSHQSDCLCERMKCIPDPSDCTRGMWNETAPMCEKITCPELPSPPKNGYLVKADSTCDGLAVYNCSEGYYLTDGDLTRNCTEYGTWTGKHPVCSIKQCTAIQDSTHRSHFPLENSYGTVVQFSCEECYEFSERAYDEEIKETESIYPRFHLLMCEATGNWNGSAPICKQKRCSNPAPVANGRIIGNTDFHCGATIKYQCNEGYYFKDGSLSKRTCNGKEWSGTAPKCIPVDCGDIDVKLPLVADYIKTLYGYKVSYSCGKNKRERRCYYEPKPQEGVCQADGTWEAGAESCTRMECQTLPKVDNADISPIFRKLNDTVCGQQFMIKCNEGYKRQGSAYVKCSGTSWFPTKLPSCNKKECRAQPSPPNGVVSPSHEVQSKEKVYYGSTLEYSCNDCYHLQGAQVRKCMSDNKDSVVWSVVEPSCAKVKCTLPAIMNGKVSNGYTDSDPPSCGDVVQFQCVEGYKLVGRSEATCTQEQTFDTVLPTCEEIKCPFPAQREHMITQTYPDIINHGIYKPNTEIEYECEEDWELKESYSIITCQNNGIWSNEPPRCIPHSCDETLLSGIQYAIVTNTTDILRSIKCDECYQPTNPSATELRCSNGLWEPPTPTSCEVIKCGNPGMPENGMLNEQRVTYHCRDSVTFSCEDGYGIMGPTTIMCREDGTWDNTFPTCVEKTCPELEEVKNAKTNYTNKGQQVHYECLEGYELYGDAVRRCFNGSQWSGPGATSCKVKHCGSVGDILFGSVNLISAGLEGGTDTPGAKALYKCRDDRYQLIGEDTRQCQNNKQWSFAPPECKCVSCPVLSIINGRVETADENRVGTSVQYICDYGYKLIPERQNRHSRKCLETGEWDGIAPKCERFTCGHPRVPEGGRIETNNKTEFQFLEKVKIICEPWKNKLVYTCGQNGQWTGDTDKNCESCKEVEKKVVTHVTRVIPGFCILGFCLKEQTIDEPVITYKIDIVCS